MNSPESGAGAGASEFEGAADIGEERSSLGEGKNEDIFWEVVWGETAGDAEIEEGWIPAAMATKTARDKATQKPAVAAIDVRKKLFKEL